jgi:enamine deaminase RidA (YjgF/YER057c/UK114 family)
MSKSVRALAGREQGQFPISTGTSRAIESLANMIPDQPKIKPAPMEQIDVLLVNVRTIYRNMLGSIKAVVKEDVVAQDIADFITQEMTQIRTAVTKISNGKVDTYFYLCRYPKLKEEFPHAQLILPQTPKQQRAKQLEDQTMDIILANPSKHGAPKILDYFLAGDGLQNDRAACLTHLPLDLVKRYEFKELYLLESNTGAFKSYRDFSSKFKVKPAEAYFPFSLFTLQIFGDGGKMFAPLDPEVVQFVAGLSKRFHWTYMTSAEKIKFSLNESGTNKFKSFLKTLLRD